MLGGSSLYTRATGICISVAGILWAAPVFAQQSTAAKSVVDTYCVTCHSDKGRTAGLTLQSLNIADPSVSAETWEKVIRKVRVGAMPPQGMPRPDKTALDGFASYLETSLDRVATSKP